MNYIFYNNKNTYYHDNPRISSRETERTGTGHTYALSLYPKTLYDQPQKKDYREYYIIVIRSARRTGSVGITTATKRVAPCEAFELPSLVTIATK